MSKTLTTQCPHCHADIRYHKIQYGSTLRCGLCAQIFKLTQLKKENTPPDKTNRVHISITTDDRITSSTHSQRQSHTRRLHRVTWGFLSILLLTFVLSLYLYGNFNQLARQEHSRWWLSTLCSALGCSIPEKVDVTQIKSSNLYVSPHPDFSGALLIHAIIYNRASFNQTFPLLQLNLSDQNGHLLTQRVFNPQEYLDHTTKNTGYMRPQIPVHIRLEILKPSADTVVDYHLSFISPN